MSKRNPERENAENLTKIMTALEEYIFQNHKLPSKTQIAELTEIAADKCNELIDQLIQQKKLYSVFGGGKGLPEVIISREMMQSILHTQKRPGWIDGYSFKERKDIGEKINDLRKELEKYEMFERVLYLTDIPLEEAIAYTLDWLGFDNVAHHIENKDYADITFDYKGVKALIEVEGTTKQGDKGKVLQLDGWIRVEIEGNGKDPSELQGFFIVNSNRELDPKARKEPLTRHAVAFLRRYQFRFISTVFLFEKVKAVLDGKLTNEEAQSIIWKGEEIK